MNRIHLLILVVFLSVTGNAAALENKKSQITEILASIKIQQGYPGISLAIFFQGDIYADQIGYADIAAARAVNSETIFRVYSVTKGLTEVLTKVLNGNDIVDLNAPIETYLPGLPIHLREITGQQLLSHRSGIRHYRSNDEWLQLSQKHCSSPPDAFDSFINDPLVSEIGAEEIYSSFGYVLLSGVLEAAAGEPFANLMSKYVFEPSKTERIEFDNPEKNISQNVTNFYEPSNGQYIEAPSVDNSCKFGGGGVNSTPIEIAKILGYYLSGKLTNETSWRVSSSLPHRISFGGEGLGGRSALIAYPQEKLVVVLVANSRGGNLQPYATKISELILAGE